MAFMLPTLPIKTAARPSRRRVRARAAARRDMDHGMNASLLRAWVRAALSLCFTGACVVFGAL